MCDFYPGVSCGDPRFTGGDGNNFYFHGKKDKDFCILSDANLHINAHFIGKRNPAMSRDFTWIQALGVRFAHHHLYVGARRAVEWDEDEDHIQITLDAEPVDVDAVKNARWVSAAVPGLSVTDRDNRIHGYGRAEGGDSLVHLDLGFQFHNLTKDVDGVLGQTYRPGYASKVDIRAKMPIMGGAPKYLSKAGLFHTDCAVSRFHRNAGAGVFAS